MSDLSRTNRVPIGGREGSIVLSERDANELKRLLRLLMPTVDRRESWTTLTHRPDGPFLADDTLHVARAVLLSRQARTTLFASSIFGEPAWDILLTLFVAEREGLRLTVSRLAEVSGARLTTAIRWIDYLEQSGLIERQQHPHDARVVMIDLTEQANQKLETYFRTLVEAGYVS